MCVERLPRPVSMTKGAIAGRCGPVISSTSAPCAARVRPHTGPAMMRVRSSTRRPCNGCVVSAVQGGKGCGGASPMRSRLSTGSDATACPCRCASHCSKLRSAVTTSPASAAAVSKPSARQLINASCTALRSLAQPSKRNTPSRWCAKFVCRRTHPSAQRYAPAILSHSSGAGAPSTRR